MSKKEKKIEIQIVDAQVVVDGQTYEGVQLILGKKTIGEIAELGEGRFATVKNEKADAFYKKLEQAVAYLIENYNLNH
ncbi:DUF2969 domain-containing protein [Streptococcus sp. DD13]|uniref:DUF2969 domain-containing protein n=1 Tax=Streptococcus sp. DD13 TaxID=1777881 RepID=UPI0007989DD2|nr:DUF2969 domain-containing protein [Streptococcus sp. DD13]KXT78916.1 hypothetical protein STRDD13_00346 [Streptococcus sp. DD13]